MTSFIDKKYINLISNQLEKFKWAKNNLANCRCPICGDSRKNKTKARFYFFESKNKYFTKCHNCGYSSDVYGFLDQVNPSLKKEYSVEIWKEKNGTKREKLSESQINSMFSKPVFKPKDNLLKPLVRVKDLPDNHVCKQFVEMRKIPKKFYGLLYHTDDFYQYMKLVDPDLVSTVYTKREPRLVIPFFDKKNNVVAVQGRSLSMKDEYNARTTLRYITVKSDKSIERLWYGMWRANPKKRVYVVEGPLDSMFIDNTIAMVGAASVENEPARFINSDMVYVLDNEPRNPQIIKFNENLINQGKTVCIWPNEIKDKDINDMIYRMSPKEIKKIMDDNAVSGLEAKIKLSKWRKI
tara:strand:+ start:2547 stop:3602 length:1056 start_codon:yes stop_codon:yes gene_type:complete